MARAMNRLTAAKVQKTKIPGRFADGGGLYLQIGPTGGKSCLYLHGWLIKNTRTPDEDYPDHPIARTISPDLLAWLVRTYPGYPVYAPDWGEPNVFTDTEIHIFCLHRHPPRTIARTLGVRLPDIDRARKHLRVVFIRSLCRAASLSPA